MSQPEKWVTFDDEEEALSPSDFPVAKRKTAAGGDDGCNERKSNHAGDDFEFRISIGGGGHLTSAAEAADMCAADEVFFQGQMLPLRPSVSSDNGLSAACQGPSRCGSLSESIVWHPADVLGLGFNTSRSNSTRSGSSSCISRSHSSNSHTSSGAAAYDPPRRSLYNNFYSHPSPTPRVRVVRNVNAGRRSTGSAPVGWRIFRLGVVNAPEIELYDLRSRRSNSGGGARAMKGNSDVDRDVRLASRDKACDKASKYSAESNSAGKSYEACSIEAAKAEPKKKAAARAAPRAITGFAFSCKCSPDDVETSLASKSMIAMKRREEKTSLKRAESVGRSSRMFEWLEELSAAKAAARGEFMMDRSKEGGL